MSRNPYTHPEPWEAGGEPMDDEPLTCRACGGVLVDAPGQFKEWNGWFWCPEHAEEMERLSKSPDAVNEVRR